MFVSVPCIVLVSFVNRSCLFWCLSFLSLLFRTSSISSCLSHCCCWWWAVNYQTHTHIHPNRLKNLRLLSSIFINRHTLDSTYWLKWTNSHWCTSWSLCPLDGFRFFHSMPNRVHHSPFFCLLLTTILFFCFAAVFPLELTWHLTTMLIFLPS
jgi:hypothetical protein